MTNKKLLNWWNNQTKEKQQELRRIIFAEMAHRSHKSKLKKYGAEGFREVMRKLGIKGNRVKNRKKNDLRYSLACGMLNKRTCGS